MLFYNIMVNCKTCKELISEKYNFCPNCGARQVKKRLSIKLLLKNLIFVVSNLDFSFYRTSKWLLIKPETVTIAYINGVRKVINPPLQYAFIVLSVYSLFQFFFSDFLDLATKNNFLSGFRDGFNNYETSSNQRYENMNDAINWLQSRNQFITFSMIPFISLFSSLLYRKKTYNLAEYTVLSIYTVSFITILSVSIGLILAPIGNETAIEYYVISTFFLNITIITWVFTRSLKGSIFKPLIILVLSSLVMLILLTFVLILMSV